MKKNKTLSIKLFFITLVILVSGSISISAQDASTDVNILIKNVSISSDRKVISYDVLLQNMNTTYDHIAIPSFLIRLAVPKADLINQLSSTQATNFTVSISDTTTELGATGMSISTLSESDPNWIMTFKSHTFVSDYTKALKIAQGGLIRIGRFSLTNNDGPFSVPVSFEAQYADGVTNPTIKSTVAIFQHNTTTFALASNSTKAQPKSNFVGLETYSLSPSTIQLSMDKDPTVTLTKAYDGTTAASVTAIGNLQGVLANDAGNVTVAVSSATYNTPNAGSSKTITIKYALSGSAAQYYAAPANYTISTGVITALPVTITNVTASNKVYDGSVSATLSGGTLNGVLAGDVNNVTIVKGTGTFDSKNVGNWAVTTTGYSLSGSAKDNYALSAQPTISAKATITAQPVSVTNTTVQKSKAYDGTNSVSITSIGTMSGKIESEDVGFGAIATYNDATVNSGKTITVTYSLIGNDKSNYTAPGILTFTDGVITKKQLSIGTPTLTTVKTYNGTTAATVTPGSLSGIFGSEVVSASAQADYSDVNSGTGKTITVKYSISGANAGNYIAPADYSVTNGEISKLQLVINTPTLTTEKVYNKTTTAAVTAGSLINVVGTESITPSATANYTTADAGSGKTITVKYTISGATAGNYIAPVDYSVSTGKITAAPLTITGITASTKVYDGTTTATLSSGTLNGTIISGDVVNIDASTAAGTFSSETVGSHAVTASGYKLTGDAAGNYALSAQPTIPDASITARSISIANESLTTSKVYDGNTTATITNNGNDILSADKSTATLTTTATYNSQNINATSINVVYQLTGTRSGNYKAPDNKTVSGTITPKSITVANTSVQKSKEYNGDNKVTITSIGDMSGIVGSEDVILGAIATYNDATVNSTKTITVAYNLTGTAKGNYSTPINLTIADGAITKRQLAINTPTLKTLKIYDGVTTAAVTAGSLTNIVGSESVTPSATADYSSVGVGTGKTITVKYAIDGTDAGNYIAPVNYTVSNGEIDKGLTLTVLLEGLWDNANLKMNKCKKDADKIYDQFDNDISDKVSVELHVKGSYKDIDQTFSDLDLHQNGSITTNGFSGICIPPTITGDYYITVKSRNCLPIASNDAISFAGNNMTYDFTDAVSKAFKSDESFTPMKNVKGKYMLYAGDVLDDGLGYQEINIGDVYAVFNNRSEIQDGGKGGNYGYTLYDLNGDGSVDDTDVYLVFNNRDVLLYRP